MACSGISQGLSTFWVHMLTLGFASAKSHPQDQLIRAELSSNGTSESRSESTSKLSSHQIPHCPRVHYAFGGVSALCVLFALCTPLRPRGRTGVFRRREGPASPVHLGHPLLPALALWCFSCTRRLLTPRCAACGSTLLWVCSPFSGFYVILLVVAYLRALPVRGRTDVLSRPRLPVSSKIASHFSSLLSGCSAESICTGAVG